MNDCIFCKIVAKEIPGKVVYEDDICLAFLDLSQATLGHTLVVPKKHYDSFLTVDDETLAHMSKITKQLANKITNALCAEGVNILTNANEVAGQTVKHFHIHILPRYDEQELKIGFVDHSDSVDLDELLEKIK